MSVRFSWTVQESDGDAAVGLNVDLYYGGGAKYADMTDNGDGSYYCTVTTSGKYDVYIGGVKQDEGTGIWIATDDTPTAATVGAKADKVSGATNNNFASLDATGNLKDSTYDATDFLAVAHQNANGAGGSTTPATNMVHNAAAIGIADAGSYLTATQVEAALQEIMAKIGPMDLSTGTFISDMTTITAALLALNNQLYDLYIRGGDSGSTSNKAYFVFTHSGDTGAATYATIGSVTGSATHDGINLPRSGSVTRLSLYYSDYDNIAVVPVNIYLRIGGSVDTLLLSVGTNGVGNNGSIVDYSPGTVPVVEGPGSAYNVVFTSTGGASSLESPVVVLEITFI